VVSSEKDGREQRKQKAALAPYGSVLSSAGCGLPALGEAGPEAVAAMRGRHCSFCHDVN
jgi:hypothetical protein